ncbi:MAG: DNA polymerase III subunit delta [Planctomycetes bacterium]|nr:DNA polymerase III subunit delta [Planctomycetota bacterium]
MAKKTPSPSVPPIIVIFGGEEFRKAETLAGELNGLLPPDVDRGMALCEYDGSRSEEQGGPTIVNILDDLATLPFLAPRRVVVIRDADKFITLNRERLERYVAAPAPTGVLILVCRTFPAATRLAKASVAARGRLIECKAIRPHEVPAFIGEQAALHRKKIEPLAVSRLADRVGPDQGRLVGDVEKLALFVEDRPAITAADVDAIVEPTREEKIFAAVDAAGLGKLREALVMWRQMLALDKNVVFPAMGGIAWSLRNWINAHNLLASGLSLAQIAPRVQMWQRDKELALLLKRIPARKAARLLAATADLDAQAKSGGRSIEMGVEALLVEIAQLAE